MAHGVACDVIPRRAGSRRSHRRVDVRIHVGDGVVGEKRLGDADDRVGEDVEVCAGGEPSRLNRRSEHRLDPLRRALAQPGSRRGEHSQGKLGLASHELPQSGVIADDLHVPAEQSAQRGLLTNILEGQTSASDHSENSTSPTNRFDLAARQVRFYADLVRGLDAVDPSALRTGDPGLGRPVDGGLVSPPLHGKFVWF